MPPSKEGRPSPPCGPYRRQKEAQRAQEAKAGTILNAIGAQRTKYQEQRPKEAQRQQKSRQEQRAEQGSRRPPPCLYTYIRAKKPQALKISVIYNYYKYIYLIINYLSSNL